MVIGRERLYKNHLGGPAGFAEPHMEGHPYEEIIFNPRKGRFYHLQPQCRSAAYYGAGACRCLSHDPFTEREISEREAVEILREWGILFDDNIDARKVRRRVEDRLRKSAPDEVYRVAVTLGVPLT